MLYRIFRPVAGLGLGAAILTATGSGPLSADDTEIYQSEFDAASGGAQPKVLIVFDDSGSMRGEVDQQRPPYDPNESYEASFDADRIYWSTDGSVPDPGNSRWFSASQNRCDASYSILDEFGRFTPERARRWVDSNVEQGQCTNVCPDGTEYRNPPGPNNAGCYEQTTVTTPVSSETTDWVYVSPQQEDCESDTVIPGTWQGLSSSVHSPPHVECLDDVNANNAANGSGHGDGYPQTNVATGNEYGNSVDNSVDWGNTAYTFYTAHYLDWYHDESLVEPQPKIDIAANVITTIIETNTSVDFGLLEFNREQGGRITQRIIQDMTETNRTNLVNLVDALEPAGLTPLCESVYESYLYLAGLSPVYSGEGDYSVNSQGNAYDIAPPDSSAVSSGDYVSPNTDCAYTYIIVMTDGLPHDDQDANTRIETLTGKTCNEYDSEDGNAKNCMPELAEYMATHDLDGDTTNGDQFGITYTIGFDTDQQLLEDTAEKGKGVYYTANNAQELTEAFQGALVSILSRDTTFTSPAVAVDTFTRTQSRNEVFYAMFKPSSSIDWAGNIKKLKFEINNGVGTLVDANGAAALDADTGDFKTTAVTFWNTVEDGGTVEIGGVGALLAARNPGGRTLYIDTGTNGTLEAFNTTNIDAAAMGAADDSALYSIFGASTQAAFNKQIAWAMGYDAYDQDGDSTVNEARNWIIGDILHSQPLVLNYGARGSHTTANPDMRILVGSNSGWVHLFRNSDGQESWGFFPRELAGNLPLRRRNPISNDHVYGMDLTPVAYTYDANNDGTLDSSAGDKVWAYLGMRRGGKSYYALNLSNPDSPAMMWRIGAEVSGFSEMGQTWSEPVITRIPGYFDSNGIPKPVLIFGAGYDTNKDASGVGTADSEGRGVFIVDAETGAMVWSVTPAANSSTNLQETGLFHSVPGDVTVLDSNGDELTDRIYFGDTGGNLWRVDLHGNARPTSSQDTWFISKLGDFNGGTTATDRRFFNAPDVVRIRFNGEAVDAVIIGSGDRTNPNATDVDNRLYMIRDLGTAPYDTAAPSSTDCADPDFYDFRCGQPFSETDLFDITSNVLNEGTDTEKAGALESLKNAQGWWLDLANAGEKSLAKTLTINGRVYATTFTPSNQVSDINVCEPQSGTGLLYVIDLYGGERSTINLGSIIPDTPSVHFGDDGQIRILLPPGTPESSIDDPGEVDCSGGVCDVNEFLRPPYGNYWFQEEY